MPIRQLTIIGTGLIGASAGLALHARGFPGRIVGWDRDPEQARIAQERGAIESVAEDGPEGILASAAHSDIILLAVPVFGILDWIEKLAPRLGPDQLLTDAGSVKTAISMHAQPLYGGSGQAGFLPGHPMAGKEMAGASAADASLFDNAVWLFTPFASHPLAEEWRMWVERMGCRIMKIDAVRHDEICAWVSHLPQMLATGLSALLEEHFGGSDEFRQIGGRALHEMTRLGASPYSMWRDIALANSEPIAAALLALEQKLAHIRENLTTPELRREFSSANSFRHI